MPKLKQNEVCPLHRRRDCCGRGGVNIVSKCQSRHYEMVAPGVKRFHDGREVCSPAALRMRKDQLLRTNPRCIFCCQVFDDYRDVDLAHVESKGMNGWRRDDRFSNLVLAHRISNIECGSRSVGEYMNDIKKAGKQFPCEKQ